MAGFEDFRVFVGGLSWDTTDKSLEHAFRRFGKVVEAKVMLDRDTGRPRGFGFVTFTDDQCVEDAIGEMHNGELDGRIISVNKAQPQRFGGGDYMYGGGGYSNGGGRGGYSRGGGGGSGGGGSGGGGRDECFKCGKSGHWARECTFGGGGGGGGRFPPRYGGGGGRTDSYGGGGGPGYGGRYGEKDRGGDRDRDRYGGGGSGGGGGGGGRDRYGSDRYDDGYGGDGYERASGRGSARYGSGGPARHEGSFRDRSGPYERPSGRSYDDRY